MDRYRGLLERYVELYNAGDLDGVMDLYAEDAVQLMPDRPSSACCHNPLRRREGR